MTTLILDTFAEEQILAARRENGHDRYDEVWDGVYVMSQLPEWYHQIIVRDFITCLHAPLRRQTLGQVVPGCNVSDRAEGWTQNFRGPDVVVFLNNTTAKFHGTHWEGGPDFAVEIASDNDRTWDKLDFYAQVNTRELLIVDRNPWRLTLLRPATGKMVQVGCSTLEDQAELPVVIPFSFRLVQRSYGPAIEIKNLTDGQLSYAAEDAPLVKA